MEERLQNLYLQCINELNSIGINTNNIGQIDISISKKASKRYGCCKQEKPDKNFKIIFRNGYRKIIRYEKFEKHHIVISKWVMALNDEIIKNTIMHEIIHCFPYCNNHGKTFKQYANIINYNLNYNITRLGNKEEDCKKSNINYIEKQNYKYKIQCEKCGQTFFRQRFNKNLIKKYRCGLCRGKLKVQELI
jgi:predicted SprT family Zn-dependent metalloprotease